jgi:Na+/proline symporter
MVGLFVPLTMGLYGRRGGESAALAAMAAGMLLWAAHLAFGWETLAEPWLGQLALPQELAATVFAWLVYEAVAAGVLWRTRSAALMMRAPASR